MDSINYINFYINNIDTKLLVDTGASICAIKYCFLLRCGIKVHQSYATVTGIGGTLQACGYVYLNLKYQGVIFRQKFYAFKNLPCCTDGILGQNFLKSFSANLNFADNYLTLHNNEKQVQIPIIISNSLVIPPRCEIITYLPTRRTTECVVIGNEIHPGVFLGSSIASPTHGAVAVKILNTTENELQLKRFEPKTHDLNEYNLCTFTEKTTTVNRVKKIFTSLKLHTYLNKEEQSSIENICAKYCDIFHLPGDKLTVTNVYEPSIKIKQDVTPIYVKQYRIPFSQKKEIKRQVDNMLKNDIIEKANSEWSSPILLVPKKIDNSGEKKWRLVIDYRKLNQVIHDDKFPLPNITDILDSLSGAVYFSHLDLAQSYYQANLLPGTSRECTAFTTDEGQFQMKRLPMGLKISASCFSRLMTVALSGLNYESCLIYMDDIIVFGRNLQNHNKNLQKVFERLRDSNLKLNPDKCEFLKKQILYLGHVISEQGILPDPDKTKTIENFPVPKTADEVKRFVAFANYYRKFIPNFASIAIPLNELCRKNVQFKWTLQCENSFQKLKECLIKPPILDYPDLSPNNQFILKTDASSFSVGSVLCNNNNKPVAFASRGLNKAEKNYSVIEKELLSIVWSVKYFRPYLYGRRFVIQTDHKPLVYLFSMTNPSSRLTKFRLCLEEYDFHVEYIKGRDNVAADALSRILISSKELKQLNNDTVYVLTRGMKKRMQGQTIDTKENKGTSTHTQQDPPNIVEVLKRGKNDFELKVATLNDLRKIPKPLRDNSYKNIIFVLPKKTIYVNPDALSPETRDELVKDLVRLCKDKNINELTILKCDENNILMKALINIINKDDKWSGPRINVVNGVRKIEDDDEKRIIINDFHLLPTSGHAGVRRMLNNMRKYFYWTGMEGDVKEYVRRCEKCQKQKHTNHYTKQPMTITTTAHSAFDKLYLDIVGPLERDNYEFCYILTLQCELSKFVEIYPLRSKDSNTIAKTFTDNFILRYGIPREIASDRGAEFVSKIMREVCELLNIKQTLTTAYHHQSVGALENSHKGLNAYLRIQTDNQPYSWSSWLPYWAFSYNNSVHSETCYTPYELVFGRRCVLPSNLENNVVDPIYNFNDYSKELKYRLQKANLDARNNLVLSKHKRKEKYDKNVNEIIYKNKDLILVKNEVGNKMSPVYNGPYSVIKDDSPNVIINVKGKHVTVHKNRTKRYYT